MKEGTTRFQDRGEINGNCLRHRGRGVDTQDKNKQTAKTKRRRENRNEETLFIIPVPPTSFSKCPHCEEDELTCSATASRRFLISLRGDNTYHKHSSLSSMLFGR